MAKTAGQLQCELRQSRQRELELTRSNENLMKALMQAMEMQRVAVEEMGRSLKEELARGDSCHLPKLDRILTSAPADESGPPPK